MLAGDLVRDEGAHRGIGLEAAVGAVEDLDARALATSWNGNGIERRRRGELLVREPGDDHAAVDEREVGDRLDAAAGRASIARRLSRSIRKAHLCVINVVQRRLGQLALGVGPAE